MKKLLCLILLLLLLPGCAGSVDLMPGADAEKLHIYQFDGETSRQVTLYGKDAGKLLRILREREYKPVEVDPTALRPPVYGFKGDSMEGWDSVGGLWADGVFLCEDGSAYALDLDFSHWFEESHENADRLRLIPCIHFLAKAGKQWNTEYLYAMEYEMEPPPGISAELVEQNGADVTVCFTNQSQSRWHYYDFDLEVEIGGIWYWVPLAEVLPSVQPQKAGIPVEVGASEKVAVSLDRYGELPRGDYRLIINGLSVNFSVE